jgi:cell division protein FtsW
MSYSSSPPLRNPLAVEPILSTLVACLVLFSLVMVYSTTGIMSQERFGDSLFFFKRQMTAALLGFGIAYLAFRIPIKVWQRIAGWLLPISLLLLVLPFIPGLGDRAGGAQRWIALGPVKFQPAEFVKIAMVVFMAGYIHRHEHSLGGFVGGIVKPVAMIGPVALLLLMQPDFGSTVVITTVMMLMGIAAGVRLRFAIIGLLMIAAAFAALVIVSPYRMERITAFLSPFEDLSGSGYQLVQSLVALGSGELVGMGLGSGQQKLFYLPAAHTDFIFAVIGEELGFIGCAVVISVFLAVLWRGCRLASRYAEDSFRFSLAVGLTGLIVVPALVNVGVVTGMLPTKGMVLPLVGYGGSSLMACLFCVGLLLALARELYEER